MSDVKLTYTEKMMFGGLCEKIFKADVKKNCVVAWKVRLRVVSKSVLLNRGSKKICNYHCCAILFQICGIYDTTGKTNMASNRGLQIGSAWFQRKINLRPQHRGVHLVTEEILRQMPELGQFSVGLCHVQSKWYFLLLFFAIKKHNIWKCYRTVKKAIFNRLGRRLHLT